MVIGRQQDLQQALQHCELLCRKESGCRGFSNCHTCTRDSGTEYLKQLSTVHLHHLNLPSLELGREMLRIAPRQSNIRERWILLRICCKYRCISHVEVRDVMRASPRVDD